MAPGICVYREVGNRCSQKWTSQRNFRFFWKAWRLANRNVAAGGGRLKLTFPATTLARKRTQSIGRVKSSVLVIFVRRRIRHRQKLRTWGNCLRLSSFPSPLFLFIPRFVLLISVLLSLRSLLLSSAPRNETDQFFRFSFHHRNHRLPICCVDEQFEDDTILRYVQFFLFF